MPSFRRLFFTYGETPQSHPYGGNDGKDCIRSPYQKIKKPL